MKVRTELLECLIDIHYYARPLIFRHNRRLTLVQTTCVFCASMFIDLWRISMRWLFCWTFYNVDQNEKYQGKNHKQTLITLSFLKFYASIVLF